MTTTNIRICGIKAKFKNSWWRPAEAKYKSVLSPTIVAGNSANCTVLETEAVKATGRSAVATCEGHACNDVAADATQAVHTIEFEDRFRQRTCQGEIIP